MAESELLLQTVEAVHAAGLNAELWPQALAAITRLVGGAAATLEIFDRPAAQITAFHSHGLPTGNDIAYFEEFAARNPRIPLLINGRPGNVVFDYMLIDERAMDRNVFYADFLAPTGYRYCVGGTLAASAQESTLFSVQRLAKQGHVEQAEIATMRRLLPHVRQAHDVSRRLGDAVRAQQSLACALDWVADGAGLLRRDGRLSYANPALRAIAGARDGIRIARGGKLAVSASAARARLAEAIASACRLRDGETRVTTAADFPVPRPSGAPPYLMSLRPLVSTGCETEAASRACAILLVRDPLRQAVSDIALLRDLFGLTAAEAHLARALQAGVPPAIYARRHMVSPNTVYTHLRRVKDKTGCRRQAELVRLLGGICPPLRDA